jgi:hypothetical protein
MPSSNTGFTGQEIVTHIQNYTGNQSSEFATIVGNLLALSEYRYCKMHDWKFLQKRNRSLTVASGTDEYALTSASVGFYIQADDVNSIYSTSSGIYLEKTSLETIRRMDVKQDDGTSASKLTHWAPVGDNEIIVYPKTFSDTVLKVDGKATPSALLTLSNYPTIPFRNQESFIKYVLAQALERENDARADGVKQEALMMIRQDIQDDMGKSGSIDDARVKHFWEAGNDGVGGDVSFNPLDT